MDSKKQKDAFLEYEADAWFNRNREVWLKYSKDTDPVINLIKDYGPDPKNVLEIACSAGYRLDAVKNLFPHCSVFGLEPSNEAVKYGQHHFPDVNL